MLTEQEILNALDNYRNGFDPPFAELGHPYVYPIDSRINIFRNNQDKWALAIEVLGYNPRGDSILLHITYYGNCLINLQDTGRYYSNSYNVSPIDKESFDKTIEYETLNPDAEFWVVRGVKIRLSHSKDEYKNAGIELKEFEPNEISVEEAGRFLVTKHRDLFRATDQELYKSIPTDVDKIMVIDEWYHRDFHQNISDVTQNLLFPRSTDEQWNDILKNSLDDYNKKNIEHNNEEWNNNRPGSYETWQQVAKVIVTGDTSNYKPTLEPNSHWSNWPDAGSM